jgi:uncharacterized protein YcfJ
MRNAIPIAVLAALAGTSTAATDLIDTAPVISSTPIVERVVEPRQDCSAAPPPAPAAQPQHRDVAGSIIGGIAGGLLGAQIGKGSGKTVAAAAGAATGAIIGDRVANPNSDRPVAGAVVGAAAGGLLGAQVGRGSGQNAAAAAGAIAGAVVGDHVQNAQRTAAAPAPVCRTVETTREVIRGYTVVYRYNERDITTTLPYDPGQTVRVGVGVIDSAPAAAVTPADYPGPAPMSASSAGYPYRY